MYVGVREGARPGAHVAVDGAVHPIATRSSDRRLIANDCQLIANCLADGRCGRCTTSRSATTTPSTASRCRQAAAAAPDHSRHRPSHFLAIAPPTSYARCRRSPSCRRSRRGRSSSPRCRRRSPRRSPPPTTRSFTWCRRRCRSAPLTNMAVHAPDDPLTGPVPATALPNISTHQP